MVTIDIPGDDREVPGLCWTHRLRLLGKQTRGDQTDDDQTREPGAR